MKKSVQEESKVDSDSNALMVEKKYLTSLAKGLGINYFSGQAESFQMDISLFMYNRISELANKWGVQLLSFSPSEIERKGDYTQNAFETEIKASYGEMINFFYELEEMEKLFVNNLKITASKGDKSSRASLKHTVQFRLSCLEFNNPLLKDLKMVDEKSAPTYDGNTLLTKETAIRDPFSNPFETTAPFLSGSPSGFVDLSGELNLMGIITSPYPRAAIIDRKMVKKGDIINGKEIIEIKKDRAILKMGEQLYILKMKEVVSPKNKDESNYSGARSQ
ncbi:MAG: GspMb/PilO family protein [Thermodesulfobacteriota bacterium]|nr:GspMb/PilO family protein [Thermodesulfobacteriota bacterium]